ncbi:peroxidase [Streptomyces sp. NPDC048281]|uniref:Dyp-type peroxidase n=1 Tax=Streptomyces sp. NPDC048281 TaxID=3154715 RepID=UPI003425F591
MRREEPMSSRDRLGREIRRAEITLDLDDIQATVLRARPTPYYGTHILLRVDDEPGGRELLGRIAPYVDPAGEWWDADETWTTVGLSFAGLTALGLPDDSLRSFPESFREGMAARSDLLLDHGENAPENWAPPFNTTELHIWVSVFSSTVERWKSALETAEQQFRAVSGVTVLMTLDFGAQPADRNPLGYQDGIGQPAIEGSGVAPLPGQGRPIKAGEFVLGYPGETGVPLPVPRPEALGRNGTFAGIRNYQARAGAFNRFLRENAMTDEERELLAAKLVGRWRSGAPLTLAPERDDPELAADPQRNNAFGYAEDTRGYQVPLGAHMRRMNPRDTQLAHLTDPDIHRVIRRGTSYGAPYDPAALSVEEDEVPRGIFFMFISANAMGTIEFLQRQWINNGDFVVLGKERDPILGLQDGDKGIFTIPRKPVRRRVHGVETFNVLRGGEYFFLPSITALNWIANLGDRS